MKHPFLKSTGFLLLFLLAAARTAVAQAPSPLAVLGSGAGVKEKMDACRELARTGDAAAVPALAALLPDEQLSHMARYALEAIPDPAAGAALREAAAALGGNRLVGVIHSLGVRRDERAVDLLARRLADADAAVAAAAAGSLGRIATAPACEALAKALPAAAADRRTPIAGALLAAADAGLAAGRAGEAVHLFDLVRKTDVPAHLAAAARLGLIRAKGEPAADDVKELLRSEDPMLFATALRAAHSVPGAGLTRALAETAGAVPPERRPLLFEALGNRRDPAAAAALIAAAKEGPDPCRKAAIASLVQIGSEEALPLLVDLALAGGEPAKAAEAGLISFPGAAVDALALRLAEAPEPARQTLALQLAAQRRTAAAVPAMVKAVKAADGAVRAGGFRGLRELGGPAELGLLIELTARAPSPDDLKNAEAALGAVASRLTDRAAGAAALSAAVGSAEGAGRLALFRVLCSVGGPAALETVRKAAGHADAEFRTAARRALCEWRDADALPDVSALARSAEDPTLKILALRGYIRLAGTQNAPAAKKVESLQDALGLAARDDERKLVLGGLGQIEDVAALAAIAPHLANAALKAEAGQAAVAIAEKLADRHPVEVSEAMKAVQAGGGPLAEKAKALQERADKARPKN